MSMPPATSATTIAPGKGHEHPCPACKLGAERQGFPFDGGYLHESAEYHDLLHCNYCGAYYHRALFVAPLRRVPAAELREHREVIRQKPA
jgi:hypothetical protein